VYEHSVKDVDFSAVTPAHTDHMSAWRSAMDQVRVDIDLSELKHNFLTWAAANRDSDELHHWQAMATWHFSAVGCMAYCLNRGAEMPASSRLWFDQKLDDMLKIPVVLDDQTQELKISLSGRRNIEYVTLYSSLEAVCSHYKPDTVKIEQEARKRLSIHKPNQQMLKRLYDHFKQSFADALADKQIPQVAQTIEPIVTVLNVLAVSTGNAKAAAQHKDISGRSIKQASKAKFKVVDLNTDMSSLSPAMIPHSNMAVIYNSKTRKLSVYEAGSTALSVKGTKIVNHDEAKSFAKILREPKKTLAALRDAVNEHRVRLVMEEYIKGKRHSASGQLNKDSLVIRVFRRPVV